MMIIIITINSSELIKIKSRTQNGPHGQSRSKRDPFTNHRMSISHSHLVRSLVLKGDVRRFIKHPLPGRDSIVKAYSLERLHETVLLVHPLSSALST